MFYFRYRSRFVKPRKHLRRSLWEQRCFLKTRSFHLWRSTAVCLRYEVYMHIWWFVIYPIVTFKITPFLKRFPWRRNQMEAFSALLVLGAGNSPVTGEFPHKGQRREAFMFSLICASRNGWVNNRDAGDLRLHRAHYDVTLMRWCED